MVTQPSHSNVGSQTPFFIMGSPRTGTTLAAQILDRHSRLSVYIEMNYYGIFRPVIRMYGDLAQARNRKRFIGDVLRLVRLQRERPPTIEDVEAALPAPTFEGVLAALVQLQATQHGKARGGEKTPLHYKYLPEILTGFPDSPVLYLMRDPRDVVLSMRKAWNSSIGEGSQVWNEAFVRFRHATDPNLHLIRYEDLVKDAAGVTQEMCAALGEAYEPEMIQSSGHIPGNLRAITHIDLARLSGPVVASSIGNYKEMAPKEIREIEAACVVGMEAMGYELSGPVSNVALRAPDRPTGLVRTCYRRLRYYGFNAERWRRGMFRWKLVLCLQMHRALRLGLHRLER